MNPISLFKREMPAAAPQPAPTEEVRASLDDVLAELTKYGRPRLHCHDDMTWSCAVKMNTIAAGANFEVRSDFKQTSPLASALQCRERVRVAVRSIGGSA